MYHSLSFAEDVKLRFGENAMFSKRCYRKFVRSSSKSRWRTWRVPEIEAKTEKKPTNTVATRTPYPQHPKTPCICCELSEKHRFLPSLPRNAWEDTEERYHLFMDSTENLKICLRLLEELYLKDSSVVNGLLQVFWCFWI